ncbi:MAG TPA: ASKHA domain-containing protein [Verrucomicrobiae bacterium]|jgi:uncharacterized 2Fe-2S/4Fe-4S cluster protein (DUF4445 family)|nr:ASKHA domain-containing protein [Verrucomicrobiae bacterium]
MPAQVTLNDRTLAAADGASLFECAESLGVRVPTSCNKNGKCRECLVEVTAGLEHLNPRTKEEEHLGGQFRLSCRARVSGGGTVVGHTLRRGGLKIEESSSDLPAAAHDIPLAPAVTRDGDYILLDGKHLCAAPGPVLGAAMDLGTTTVVVRVIDLESGATVAGASFENPQRFGGSDVMARISYDSSHPGRLLQRTLIGYLNHCLEELPVNSRNIYELVIAGNATMRDLFFGLDVESIGQKPYRSLTEHELMEGRRESTELVSTGRQLHLSIHPDARVLGLPIIGGHVGADTAACLLAIAMHREERLVAMMDIGTNTEIVCGNRQKILAASCPAGPAFEGGAISCGMSGFEGAIERVRLGDNGPVTFEVIGGGAPAGICGSGLVDALGEFRRTDCMDSYGRFADGADRFVFDRERNIFLSESDISQLAQAKGANVAGLRILVNRYGVGFADLETLYLAGGFARHLDVEAAKRIGLIPDIPTERIRKIGNAAIEGASIALRSILQRALLGKLVRGVGHVELETDPDFFDHFVEGCQFSPFSCAVVPDN